MDANPTDDDDQKERIDDRPEPITTRLDAAGAYRSGADRADLDVSVKSQPTDPTIAASLKVRSTGLDLEVFLDAEEARELGRQLIAASVQSDEVDPEEYGL